MVQETLPLSRRHAREYFELPGACFPHFAYPVEMTMMPYPLPTWGWQLCETPRAVQSLWWHYQYSLDREFLQNRAWEPIKAATEFMVAYMERPEAHGPGWGDDCDHIFPTVCPEIHGGLRPGFEKNHDCLVDLTLTKFLFRAYLEACQALDREDDEALLGGQVRNILDHFPEYYTGDSHSGRVLLSVVGEDPEVIFNRQIAWQRFSQAENMASTPSRNSGKSLPTPCATIGTKAATIWSSETCKLPGLDCSISKSSSGTSTTAFARMAQPATL